MLRKSVCRFGPKTPELDSFAASSVLHKLYKDALGKSSSPSTTSTSSSSSSPSLLADTLGFKSNKANARSSVKIVSQDHQGRAGVKLAKLAREVESLREWRVNGGGGSSSGSSEGVTPSSSMGGSRAELNHHDDVSSDGGRIVEVGGVLTAAGHETEGFDLDSFSRDALDSLPPPIDPLAQVSTSYLDFSAAIDSGYDLDACLDSAVDRPPYSSNRRLSPEVFKMVETIRAELKDLTELIQGEKKQNFYEGRTSAAWTVEVQPVGRREGYKTWRRLSCPIIKDTLLRENPLDIDTSTKKLQRWATVEASKISKIRWHELSQDEKYEFGAEAPQVRPAPLSTPMLATTTTHSMTGGGNATASNLSIEAATSGNRSTYWRGQFAERNRLDARVTDTTGSGGEGGEVSMGTLKAKSLDSLSAKTSVAEQDTSPTAKYSFRPLESVPDFWAESMVAHMDSEVNRVQAWVKKHKPDYLAGFHRRPEMRGRSKEAIQVHLQENFKVWGVVSTLPKGYCTTGVVVNSIIRANEFYTEWQRTRGEKDVRAALEQVQRDYKASSKQHNHSVRERLFQCPCPLSIVPIHRLVFPDGKVKGPQKETLKFEKVKLDNPTAYAATVHPDCILGANGTQRVQQQPDSEAF